MIFAGVNELHFEPKMPVNMDALGETSTPQGMQPNQGPLANIRYKPSYFHYNVRLSSAPTTGTVSIELRDSAGTVIKSVNLGVNGVTQLSGKTPVTLSSVPGENNLLTVVNVTAALDAGITAEVDSRVSIEIPLTSNGNC